MGQLLSRLTEREREIVRLRYGIGDSKQFTCKEVAAIFMTSEVAIREELKTAVSKLRRWAISNEEAGILIRKTRIPTTGEIT